MSQGIVGTKEYECAPTSSAAITAAAACFVPSEEWRVSCPNIDVRGLLYGYGFVGNAGAVAGVNVIKRADSHGNSKHGCSWRWGMRLDVGWNG